MPPINNHEVERMYWDAKAEIAQDWDKLSHGPNGQPLTALEIIKRMSRRSRLESDAHEHAINRREFAARIAEEREI